MSRLNSLLQFFDEASTGIATPSLPPIAGVARSRLGNELPLVFWKLALVTRAHVHESQSVNRIKATEAMRVLDLYGKWALDWAIRRHAVAIRKSSDAKRIADAAGAEFDLSGPTHWDLDKYRLHGRGAQNDRPHPWDSFIRICAGIAAFFGPDALIPLCREALDSNFDAVSIGSVDFKTTLQEETQKRMRARPTYSEVSAEGPDHARVFCCRVVAGSHTADGFGPSKKTAQQAAAAALLKQIGVLVSGPATRVDETFEPDDHVGGVIAASIREAERLIGYSFKRRGLLATALTHSSYMHENRRTQPRGAFSYEPLASLGSAAVWLLGAEDYLTQAATGRQHPIDLSELLGVALKGDLIAELPMTVQLSKLLVTGKGQRGATTARLRSEVMQAVLAAVILDNPQWSTGISAADRITEPLLERVRTFGLRQKQAIDAKTALQQHAQALGFTASYAIVLEEGPHHASRYTSRVILTIHQQRFAFTGEPSSSKRGSETNAAGAALSQIEEAFQRPANAPGSRPQLDQFGAALLKSVFAALRLGAVGWRRVLAADLLGFARLFSDDTPQVISLLQRISELAERAGMSSELGNFADSLLTAPRYRDHVSPLITRFAEHWFRQLAAAEPDHLEEERMQTLIAEAKLLLAACSSLSDTSSRAIPIHVGLEALGANVATCDQRITQSARQVDVLCSAIRFLSYGQQAVVSVTESAGSVCCRIHRTRADKARIASAEGVLQCLDITIEDAGDDLVLASPATSATGWIGDVLAKLQGAARPNLSLKYVAHHLHDMKNEISAALLNAADASRDRTNRFRHLAASEACLDRARVTCREIGRAAEHATKVQVSSFALRSFLTEIVREAMVRAPSVPFGTFLDAADVSFEADRLLLRNAVENLLKNAMRAVQGGGDIRVESLFDPASNMVVIEVSNSGEPAPQSVLDALSEGGLPPSTSHVGVGFGLISVRQVADLHGGAFRLFNRDGRVHATLELPSASAPAFEQETTDD